ncbi:MAG: protein kinase [Gemmatimonadaceae bacterium]
MSEIRARLEAAVGHQFVIERELGGGGMSRVFLADETRFGRKVVIKVLTRELAAELSAERFEREISLAARLQDPHIVPVLSAGVAGDLPYYTMPFVDGESLRARTAALGFQERIPTGDAVMILRDVAAALEYAHSRGVAHRDIKPENVLLAGRTAVVTDFGIAKAISAATATAGSAGGALTQVGVTLGTPAYMAPEQVAGDEVDQRADIYAWGVMAYELLAGSHPFAHRSGAAQLMAAQVSETPRPMPRERGAVPAALNALVMRCLGKDPAGRPQNGGELIRSFDAATSNWHGSHAVHSSRPPVRSPRRVAVYALGAVALLALAALGATWGRATSRWHLPGFSTARIVANPAAVGTVAVLPFRNAGGNARDDYFSDGMTAELARALSRLPAIRVAARSSAYAFRGKGMSGQAIGKALNVATVVEGTVRRDGDRLRVTAELTSTTDGLVIWSDTYESRAGDVFAVQDKFTKSIVAALEPALSGKTASNMASASRGTSSPEAYDLYLKGRYFWNKRTADALQRGASYFEQAIGRDPNYALAYSGLADSYGVLAAFGFMEPRVAYAHAKVAALHALALDSTLAEAHASLGFIHLYSELDPPAAQREFTTAIALDPQYATARLFNGWYELDVNGPDAGLREVQIAQRLEPLSLIINTRVATMMMYGRHYDEAEHQLHKTLEMDSTFGIAEDQLARVLVARGEYPAAIANARRAVIHGYVHARGILGYSLAVGDKRAEAGQVLRGLLDQARKEYVSPYDIALVYTGLGNRDQALYWLGKSFEVRDQEILHLPMDPLLDSLHGDPRFQAIVLRR